MKSFSEPRAQARVLRDHRHETCRKIDGGAELRWKIVFEENYMSNFECEALQRYVNIVMQRYVNIVKLEQSVNAKLTRLPET